MKVVIMAGGRGTRISSVYSDIPKPMIKINEIPVLEREIVCLRDQGFTEFIITVGFLGQKIVDYFGNGNKISPATGKNFNVSIRYYFEEAPLGNAGALFKIRNWLDEDFLLLNGDVLFDIDFHRFVNYHKKRQNLITILTHPNSHPYDSGLIMADSDGHVDQWITKEEERPQYYKNRVNAGLHIMSPKVLDDFVEKNNGIIDGKVDLDRMLLRTKVGTGQLICYDSPEYVKDMGTPERYRKVCEDDHNGIISDKNLKNRQKAIFLDRDGTINRYVGFLNSIDDFELLPDVGKAIRMINESGYLAIVITNQPVIARGELTIKELTQIHNKMETLLGREGAYIDDLYYCPHHPDKGYDGEIEKLKIECVCRKPKPGMLYEAAHKYNIDLEKSWMIGDSNNDVLAGKSAGCKTAFITEEKNRQSDADLEEENLLNIVEKILCKQE